MNGRHDHTTAVCVLLRWSGGLRVSMISKTRIAGLHFVLLKQTNKQTSNQTNKQKTRQREMIVNQFVHHFGSRVEKECYVLGTQP